MAGLKQRLAGGDIVDGVVVKTPSYQVIEVLAAGGVELVLIDLEHAAIGREAFDAMLAVAVAHGIDTLVRVPAADRASIQQALDGGATGVVAPHIHSADLAAAAARWAHYGEGGRGYAGTVRSGRWGTMPMAEVLAEAAVRTVVVAQVEDLAALDHLDAIASAPGVDAVFVGAADLAAALGRTDVSDPTVAAACTEIIEAARRADRTVAAYAGSADEAARWRTAGATLIFHGSDHSRLLYRPR